MTAPADLARPHWSLDPEVSFLNHGSFGACPRPVREAQDRWRERLEREPVRFFVREYEGHLDAAKAEVGRFLGADPEDLAFVPNATTGVATVLRSLDLAAGDEVLTTDHAYPACRNALDREAARAGARVVVARVPFPIRGPGEVVEAVLAGVGPRTRIAFLDQITSPTGIVFPVERIVPLLAERGVETLVDGAHAPGMVALDLRALGAAWFTGNFHKWVCAPKGAAVLFARRDRQPALRPLVTSHGATSPRTDRSRFRLEFDWTGTDDPSAYLSVPDAIRFLEGLLPGGWAELRAHNRGTALVARRLLASRLGVAVPAPDEMIGALAALPLPDSPDPRPTAYGDALQTRLVERHRVQVPIVVWPAAPRRLVRTSSQVYNRPEEYERLADALLTELAAERRHTLGRT